MKAPSSFAGPMATSDQSKGIFRPEHNKPAKGKLIVLPEFENADIFKSVAYTELLDNRRSKRDYDDKAQMTQKQLAFMLWSAQGIQGYRGAGDVAVIKPVPCGGARHPFELYFVVQNVEGLEQGLYRYIPNENVGEKIVTIEFLKTFDNYKEQINIMTADQKWANNASIVMFFTCLPYRSEWRYVHMAHRVMLIDLGHIGQNVMLSATALGLGSCCLAAYSQQACDELLEIDGVDEYTVYAIPVGIIRQTN